MTTQQRFLFFPFRILELVVDNKKSDKNILGPNIDNLPVPFFTRFLETYDQCQKGKKYVSFALLFIISVRIFSLYFLKTCLWKKLKNDNPTLEYDMHSRFFEYLENYERF